MSTFKKCKVVMLPTKEKARFGDMILTHDNNLLIFKHQRCTEINQHLYITSDDEIKQGNWFIDKTNKIWQHNGKVQPYKGSTKIIATTNFNFSIKGEFNHRLNEIQNIIFQPSHSFVEVFVREYNKGNVITDILVEYEWNGGRAGDYEQIPKINPKDNTIIIKNVKDNWNRKDIALLFNKFGSCVYENYTKNQTIKDFTDKWIEENL